MATDGPPTTRRALLASLGAAGVGSLAGCTSILDPERQRWSYALDGTPNADLTVTAGTVLVRTSPDEGEEGRLTAVGRGSGEAVWSAPVADGDYDFAHHEASGTVLAGGPELLVAFDSASGERQFTVPVGTPAVNDPPTVVADEAGFVVLRRDGGLLALDDDGRERWRTDANVGAPVAGSLITTVAPEYDSYDGTLVALRGFRADTGEPRWRAPMPASRLRGTTAVGDRVYVATTRGGVRCLDGGEGSLVWHYRQPIVEDLATSPLVVDGDVYVGSGVAFTGHDYGTLFLITRTGYASFEYRTETTVRGPAGGGDRLFALVDDEIRAVGREEMLEQWAVSLDALLVAAGDDTCYALTRGNSRLVALRAGE